MQNIKTIQTKYLKCTHKKLWQLVFPFFWKYSNLLVWVWSKWSSAMNYFINIYMRGDIVRLRLVVAIILEVVMIWLLFWLGMNRKAVCAVLMHLLNTFLHWFCFLGSFVGWWKGRKKCSTGRNIRFWVCTLLTYILNTFIYWFFLIVNVWSLC